MKKLLALTLFLGTSTLLSAQDSSAVNQNQKERIKLITADTVRQSKDGLQTYEKDVVIEIEGKLRLEADRVTFDRANGVIMAYSTKKFTFQGETILSRDPKGTYRYKLGEDKIYLE